MGIFAANPHETKLVHQGNLGVQRLIARAKCNRDPYESGLVNLYFYFDLARGLAKDKFGVI